MLENKLLEKGLKHIIYNISIRHFYTVNRALDQRHLASNIQGYLFEKSAQANKPEALDNSQI